MPDSEDLLAIIDRILRQHHSDGDLDVLHQAISASSSPGSLQIGKYNVNIGEGKDIHIGDQIYQGADAEVIREIIKEILSSQKAPTAVKYIPYTGVRNFVGRSEELVKSHALLTDETYGALLRDWLGNFAASSMLILDKLTMLHLLVVQNMLWISN